METLSIKQKLSIARQLNLIVRTINDFQLNNWEKRNDPLFNEMVQNEKDFLFLVEYLLDTSTEIIADNPVDMIRDVENFSDGLKFRIKDCSLTNAVDYISRAVIIISTILVSNQLIDNMSREQVFDIYSA